MVKFGINTFLWGAAFTPAEYHRLAALKAAGFDGIEVPILDPGAFEADRLRRELAMHALACTACAIIPNGLSLGSSDASIRGQAQSHLQSCFSVARDAGIRLLSGPFYTPVGHLTGERRTADEWKWVVESWRELAPHAAAAGLEIGLEPLNRFETYFLNTVSDVVELCRAIGHPQVGILFDTFHANIEEKSVGAALRAAAPFLKHIHISENDRGTPGSGHVAWADVFAAVRDLGYDRWLTIESFGFSLGAMSAAAAIWRDLAPTPESIAFDGLAFVRSCLRRDTVPQG